MQAAEFEVRKALEATGRTENLTEREKHLVGLAVTITRGCVACTGGRLEAALKAGIPYATVRAAIDLAAAVNAGVALRTALEGAERSSFAALCREPECAVRARRAWRAAPAIRPGGGARRVGSRGGGDSARLPGASRRCSHGAWLPRHAAVWSSGCPHQRPAAARPEAQRSRIADRGGAACDGCRVLACAWRRWHRAWRWAHSAARQAAGVAPRRSGSGGSTAGTRGRPATRR